MPTVILSFDDTVKTQYQFAAPLLRRFGFHASFFISFFYPEWMAQHASTLMTGEELAELDAQGFDIGNHTHTHIDVRAADREALGTQVSAIEQFLAGSHIRPPVSFAYPGGHYSDQAADLLRRRGYRCARGIGLRAFDPACDDWFNIPAFAIMAAHPERFELALQALGEETAVALCYHGIPDTVHPQCSVSPNTFTGQMEELRRRQCRVISFRDYCEQYPETKGNL